MSSYTGSHGVPPLDGPWGDELSQTELLVGFANIRRLWKAPESGITRLSKGGQGGRVLRTSYSIDR